METRTLTRKNPTTCAFDLPLEDLRTRISAGIAASMQRERPIFGKPPGATFFVADARECRTWPKVLTLPGNEHDLYLHASHEPLWESPVYRGPDRGLPFLAAFHVHFAAIGPTRTSVSVTAVETEVLNGSRWGIGPCGPGMGNRYVRVDPTSIEEYMILRYIGEVLGVRSMPEVILPAAVAGPSVP